MSAPRRRKLEVHMSRTEMHSGISSTRNQNKWADALNFTFKNNTTSVAPRKRVYFSL